MLKKSLIAIILVMSMVLLAACGGQKQPETTTPAEVTTPEDAAAPEDNTPEEKTSEEETPEAKEKEEDKTADFAETPAAEDAVDVASEDPDAPVNRAPVEEEAAAAVPVPELPEDITAPDKMLDAPKDVTVNADGDVLTLRTGPDSTYDAIDAIADGEEITIEAEQDGWGLTNYNGQYGWVSLDFVVE